MRRLHPNALWLFWLRSLGLGCHDRNTVKVMQPLLSLLFYGIAISYAVFSFSQAAHNLMGSEPGAPSGPASWWQALGASLHPSNLKFALVAGLMGWLGLTFLRAYFYRRSYGYELEANSLRVQKGVMVIHEETVPYEKIQNIDIFRDTLHRLLGLSSVYIQTAGYSESTEEVVEKHPGFVAEASIDGISEEEAEQIREALINRRKES